MSADNQELGGCCGCIVLLLILAAFILTVSFIAKGTWNVLVWTWS